MKKGGWELNGCPEERWFNKSKGHATGKLISTSLPDIRSDMSFYDIF